MRKIYNQKNLVVTVGGYTLEGFFEGATATYTHDGGEVDKTQGTDGAGINIATHQGGTFKVTLRETSPSRSFLDSLNLTQMQGGAGVTVIFREGSDVIHTMNEAYVSRAGELSTGDKKQGSIVYTFMSAIDDVDNLSIEGL